MSIHVGLIGLGNIIEHHVDALRCLDAFTVTAVCDVDEPRRAHWADALSCAAYPDTDSLLGSGVDVAVVALPHHLHVPVSLAALSAGCHVLVEKPMTIRAADVEVMVGAARDAGRVLLVADLTGFAPGAVRTGGKFSAGELGRFLTGCIFNARVYFYPGRPAWFLEESASGGGMFANVGLHCLATARMALPGLTPCSVSATVAHIDEHPVEACTALLVRYAEGGSMLYEEVGYFPRPDWLNTGTHFVFESGFVSWTDTQWRMMDRDGHEHVEPLTPHEHVYTPVYEDLLRAIEGRPHWPTLDAYAEDMVVARAAYASAARGGEINLADTDWRADA